MVKLTTVLGSTNDNPRYYKFIPKQILFWKHFGCKFIAIFIGNEIPTELIEYKENIILWNHNSNIKSAFLGQNLRIYYPALLNLPDDEVVMITDMDMLPANSHYYKDCLESYTKDDFIYYRYIDRNKWRNEIYMCYNAAHPDTWGKLFKIKTIDDVINALENVYNSYNRNYSGKPGEEGWFIDQEIMYEKLHNYENLKVLNKTPRRLEVHKASHYVSSNNNNYIKNYDDMHFHRSYDANYKLIEHVEKLLHLVN